MTFDFLMILQLLTVLKRFNQRASKTRKLTKTAVNLKIKLGILFVSYGFSCFVTFIGESQYFKQTNFIVNRKSMAFQQTN